MKEKLKVEVTAKEVYRRNLLMRSIMIIIAFLMLFLSILYAILYIVNKEGNFTINLDPNLSANKKIVMSSTSDFNETSLTLNVKSLDYMDNISESWLPADLDNHEGEHSGNNYLAYTFFIKNDSDEKTSYSFSINILSVIKNVDEAVRVALYTNGEKVVYAKKSNTTGGPEGTTTMFESNNRIMYKLRKDFKPQEVDKYTIVVWLEGDDPECVDAILGGEMKMEVSLGEDKK